MALGGDHVHGVLQRTDDGGKVFPRGIKAAGADIVAYGALVLPGAMFLLGYFEDGTPVMGPAQLRHARGRDGLRSDAAQNRGGCTRHARRHRRAG